MSDFSVKRFNWVRSPSLWERNLAWRARQQEIRESSESANSSASSGFFSANLNLVTGLGSIAAEAAISRVRAKAMQSLSKLV
jgi:hypothetical protein